MKSLTVDRISMISGGAGDSPIFQCSCEGYGEANYYRNDMIAYTYDKSEIIPFVMTRFHTLYIRGSRDATMAMAEMICINKCEGLDMSMSSCVLIGFM